MPAAALDSLAALWLQDTRSATVPSGGLHSSLRLCEGLTSSMPVLLFVYGTLLSGQANHHVLSKACARREIPGRTAKGYALVIVGGYPALVRARTGVVVGE